MRPPPKPLTAVLADAIARQDKAVRARLPKAVAGDETAVHRGRVATRRLREALGIVLHTDPPKRAHRLRRELRRIARQLGPIREIDVALAEIERTGAKLGWSAERRAAFHQVLEETRDYRRARMKKKLARTDRDGLKDWAARVVEDVRTAGAPATWSRALRARISDRAARALAAIRECGTLYSPQHLHELRIALKKLRYSLEFDAEAGAAASGEAIRSLRRAQRRLGHLHDLQILAKEIDKAEFRGTADMVDARAAVADLERECRDIHGRIVRDLPALEACALGVRRGASAAARGPRLKMAHSDLAVPPDAARASA